MFKRVILIALFPLSVFPSSGAASAGNPVMEPSLNAYIPDAGKFSFKALIVSGLISSGFNIPDVKKETVDYAVFGARFFAGKYFVEPGLYFNFGTRGRDQRIYDLGAMLRLGLGWLPYFEPFHLSASAGYSDFKTVENFTGFAGYYLQKGVSMGMGAGFEFAVYRNIICSLDLEYHRMYPSVILLQASGYTANIKRDGPAGNGQELTGLIATFSFGWLI